MDIKEEQDYLDKIKYEILCIEFHVTSCNSLSKYFVIFCKFISYLKRWRKLVFMCFRILDLLWLESHSRKHGSVASECNLHLTRHIDCAINQSAECSNSTFSLHPLRNFSFEAQ